MKKSVYEFISKQNNDPIIEWKTCKVNGQPFAIFQSDLDMLDKVSPVIGGKKYALPTPSLSPEERQRRRLMWRNERKLYKRKSDLDGSNIFSMHSADFLGKVYSSLQRWSDNRNAMDYGRDIGNSLNDDIKKLINTVPFFSRNVLENTMENSDYCNAAGYLKSCYLVFNTDNAENCYYSKGANYSKYAVDCFKISQCEHVYYAENCYNCNQCLYIQDCKDSYKLEYCRSCVNCNFCFGCINLIGKSYCFFNQQLSKDEYETKLQELKKQYKNKEIKNQVDTFFSTYPLKYMEGHFNEKSYGNFIYETKNCFACYDSELLENSKYCTDIKKMHGSSNFNMDVCNFGDVINKCYECCIVGYNSQSLIACYDCRTDVSNLYYCIGCMSCKNCFGCVNIRNKEYCIFNKQYSQEEYEKEVGKLISQMQEIGQRGEFFATDLCIFPYNDATVTEYFPVQKVVTNGQEKIIDSDGKGIVTVLEPEKFISNAILDLGGEQKLNIKRRTYEKEVDIPEGMKEIKGRDVSMKQLSDEELLSSIIICEVSGRPFRIIKPELEFYHKHGISIPTKHSDIRHFERLKKRSGRNLYLKNCDKCGIEMLSVYPNIGESEDLNVNKQKVYCETCYNHEIYG